MKASPLFATIAACLLAGPCVLAGQGFAARAVAQPIAGQTRTGPAAPATGQVEPATVALSGLDGQTKALTVAELDALPKASVTVTRDQSHTYEGALLTDVLKEVGAPSGKALRGADLTDVVFIEARDGYKVVIDLADTDAITRRDRVILADRVDGKPLAAGQGPFQVIVEGDLRSARSARMVSAIALKRVR